MLAEMKFTDARRELTAVIDRVQRLEPVAILPRKQSEEFTYIFTETIVRELLDHFTFKVRLTDEEQDAYSYWLDELELYGYGETKEQALDSLVEELMMYTQLYISNPRRYMDAPNRRQHLPYVLKVSVCSNAEEVKRMLLADAYQVQGSEVIATRTDGYSWVIPITGITKR